MTDTYELKAAVLAAKENSSLPVFATVAFNEDGKLLTGASPEAVVALLEGLRVDVLGMNCGLGPDGMMPLLKRVLACTSVPVMVKPNAGLPQVVDGRTTFNVGPEQFAALVADMARAGARIVGGCCGTTPAHIAALVSRVGPAVLGGPQGRAKPSRCMPATVISSYTRTVTISAAAPVLIGERINPTGKPRLREALKTGDTAYVLREAVTQAEAGAHVLDVNVGVPGLDEAAVMDSTVQAVQGVVDLPLQLDTSSPAALEKALRHYNGKPLINSVNGKEESMRAVFPLAAKYGGVVVCLTLDEKGIPATAAGRLAVARKIVARAADYGIAPKDLLVDVLCMTVSAAPDAGAVALEAVRLVSSELHVPVSLGVSNVSFGLPSRPALNASFFTLALGAGLAAAIVNPCKREMMDAYRCYRALLGLDPQCADFIAHPPEAAALSAPPTMAPAAPIVPVAPSGPCEGPYLAPLSSSVSVRRGLAADAATAATAALAAGTPPLDVINAGIIPALDAVGKGFEAKTVYLPQLLMCAEAAAAAFEVVKKAIAASGVPRASRGPVVIATVKGDIHDIGKNIVRALLENFGFQVVDLGRDVPPEQVVAAARERGAKLVGLSALMTTTVPYMEETIKQIRAAKLDCRVMVGGAVLTADYARTIGADFYAKDAMESVHVAERIFGK